MEPIRAYLLGLLPDEQASAIEDRYFTEPAFLAQVKAGEQTLIQDFLNGQLKAQELHSFEARYLAVPALRELVDQAKADRRGSRQWLLPVAASLIVASALGVWWFSNSRPTAELAAIHLAPGVTKSASSGTHVILPNPSGSLRFALELPGEKAPLSCNIRLSEVAVSGSWKQITLPLGAVTSTPLAGGQQVAFSIHSALLHEGDYVLQLIGPDSAIIDSYVFSAAPAQ